MTLAGEHQVTGAAGSGGQTGVQDCVRQQIRGSGLLLAGRMLSTVITFCAQLLLVRYLSTTDYGAFAYAFAVVTAAQAFSTLGLHKSISRFVPIFHEKQDKGSLAGVLILAVGVIAVASLLISVAVVVIPDRLLSSIIHGQQALRIIRILVFLLPLEALNDVLISLFASFGRPRDIFLRSHVVGPVLRFIAVLALVALSAGPVFLAIGYLVSTILGTLLYSVVLARFVAAHEIFQGLALRNIRIPAREMFSFAIPILTTEFVSGAMMTAVAVLLIGYYHNLVDVAMYRVAVPAARMNLTVMASFSLLYTPLAARLFARADYEGVNRLYWRTTAWITLLTFPIFVATFSFSRLLTVTLFGARYEASANVLALLAIAFYFNVALGFNTLTLRVFGKLRAILAVNAFAVVVTLGLGIVLVPRYGPIGAAVGTAVSMVVLNVATQAALSTAPGFRVFDVRYLSVYVGIAVGSSALFLFQSFTRPNIYLAIVLGGATIAAVFGRCRKDLDMADSFPEVRNIPVLRAIFN